MIRLQRYQIVNLVYRGVAAVLIAVAIVLLAFQQATPSMVAAVAAALWLVGGAAGQLLFEPWLRQWMNETAESELATGETIRL